VHDTALLFRSVNEGVALVAADLDEAYEEDGWSFHCECGRRACDAWVTLPLARFLAITEEPGRFVLAPEHPVPRARTARQRSKELREEATALRAEASHQVRRAHKMRRPQSKAS
jgi:hypothetical protein